MKRPVLKHLGNAVNSGPSYTAQACVKGSEQSHRDTGGLTLFIWHIPNSGDHNVSFGYNLHYQPIGLGP